MHFFSVNERSELKHAGDFESTEKAIMYLSGHLEDTSETETGSDVVMYITIDDVRRLVQEFINFGAVKTITKDSYFGIKSDTDSYNRRLVYLGDFPDAKVAQEVITDQNVATALAELHDTSPDDYRDLAWVVSTKDFEQWRASAEATVGRPLW
jgi:hypothetical protein